MHCAMRVGILAGLALAVAGCESLVKPTIEVEKLGTDEVLLTDASTRAVYRAEHDGKKHFCAEPSPDVAVAFSEGISRSISAMVSGLPEGVTPQVANAVARNAAQSVAQLGERLATIQLLRDGLYRACEAHASGALSQTSYALLLSRYDDTMITMLGTEVAGGAFGRSLATLGTESTGQAAASQELTSRVREHTEALRTLKTELSRHRELQSSLERAIDRKGRIEAQLAEAEQPAAGTEEPGALREDLGRTEQEIADLGTALDRSEQSIQTAERDLATRLDATAAAAARATAVAAGPITPGQQSAEVAAVIEDIQKNYVENINTDAWDVACISALDKPEGELTALARYCRQHEFHKSSVKLKQFVFDTLMEYRLKTNSDALTAEVELARVEQGGKPAASRASAPAAGGTAEIAWAQRALNELNDEGLVIDGVLGLETRAALRRFQRENGLSPTAELDPATAGALRQRVPGP